MVYGRPDPQPGNFQPRFGSTNEFVAIASQEAHRDLGWFFDVYLRQARLPRLVDQPQRHHAEPAVEDAQGHCRSRCRSMSTSMASTQVVPMTSGHGTLALPSAIQPRHGRSGAKILRQDDDRSVPRRSATKHGQG